jgi:Camelysin metallo-endopeptidase
MSTTTRTANSATARKVLGSLAVIGAAAAVAGLGTYGNFTDSTTPVNTTIASGTLSIDLTQPGITIPVSTPNFVPGDSITRAVTLTNDGSLPLSSVQLASVATTSSVLTTDTTDGLQLTVKSCSQAWTEGGTAQAPTYTCAGTARTVLDAPVVTNLSLDSPASLNPGGVDHLTVSIALPTSAGNQFQGKTADLTLTFTGTQAAGTAR